MKKRMTRAVLVLASVWLVACSSDDNRSVVLVDLELAVGAPVPGPIDVTAWSAGGEAGASVAIKTAQPSWEKAVAGILSIGLYLPDSVVGPVTITAQGKANGVPVVAGAVGPVAVQRGRSVGPFRLVLSPLDVTPPVPEPSLDGGAVDAQGGETGARDTLVQDSAAPDLAPVDQVVADGVAPDAPVVDVADETAVDAPADRPMPEDSAIDTSVNRVDVATAIDTTPAWHPAENVEKDPVNSSYDPDVLVDPVQNHIYVAWVELAAVKVKRWSATTQSWGNTITLDKRGSPDGTTLGIDGNGKVTLAWVQLASGADESLHGMWVSTSVDGVTWSTPEHVVLGTVYDFPHLVVARNGVARMVYTRMTETNVYPMYTAYYDGTTWTDNPNLIDPITQYESFQTPQLAIDPSGNGLLLFDKDCSGKTCAAVVTMTGATVSAPVVLTDGTANVTSTDRFLAMNRKGEAVVVWDEYISGTSSIYARSYQPGVGWSAKPPAIATGSNIIEMNAALDEQGVVTIAWQQYLTTGKMNTMAIRGPVAGPWGDVVALETDNQATTKTDEDSLPMLAAAANGQVLAIWRKVIDADTRGIYGSAFVGGAWQPQLQLGLKTGLTICGHDLAVSDSGLGAAVFYYCAMGGSTDPEAYNIEVATFR